MDDPEGPSKRLRKTTSREGMMASDDLKHIMNWSSDEDVVSGGNGEYDDSSDDEEENPEPTEPNVVVQQTRKLQDYWKREYLFDLPCFNSRMSRDGWMLILRCLYFAKNPAQDDEPQPRNLLYKINPLLEIFHENIDRIQYPTRVLDLSVSMAGVGNLRLRSRMRLFNMQPAALWIIIK
ncbi:hypothetical protein QTP88_026233 [Uroleucon formosanum]